MKHYQNGADTKRHIYECAKELFLKKGFQSTTFEQICKAAHVSRRTILYHYKSKNEIPLQFCHEIFEKSKLTAAFYCDLPEYNSIVATAIRWYYILKDSDLRALILEAILPCLDQPQKFWGDHFYSDYICCFQKEMGEAFENLPKLDPMEDYVQQAVELHCLVRIAEHPEEYTVDKITHIEVRLCGRIHGVPEEVIDRVIDTAAAYIHKIPFDKLNIRW